MADIDQSRFALIAVLTRANEARPDDYPPPPTLLAMSDEGLRGYAVGLLSSLESGPSGEKVATWLQEELRRILETPLGSTSA
jgi:hypothetical protein